MDKKTLLFLRTAAIILIVTGITKWITASGEHQALTAYDRVFRFLTTRQLLFLTATIEIGVAAYVIFSKDSTNKLLGLAWLATLFLSYRAALWMLGVKAPCACLGFLWEWLHVSPKTLDNMMKMLLAYMLVGSYGLLLSKTRQGNNAKAR